MPQIEIIISPTGELTVEAKDVQGTGCSALTRAIEQALGRTTADMKKPEYHQQQANPAGATHAGAK